jgi:molecular chaperone GrpE
LNPSSEPIPPKSWPPADSGVFPTPGTPENEAPLSDEEDEDAFHREKDMETSEIEEDTDAREREEGDELLDWKEAMRRDFERWLESVEEIPTPEDEELEEREAPDLFGFYEQFAAAGAEARKANRRTAEAFSQWGETLARFETELKPLRESVLELKTAKFQENRLSNSHCLLAIELADRMRRLAAAFDKTPQKTWWSNDREWRQAWESQRQGLGILMGHLEDWLKKEGVERLTALGQPFDPSIMSAVAVEEDNQRPHHSVTEEIAPGYRRQGELLRVAQVKLTLNKTQV